jgi:hypothetical protein
MEGMINDARAYYRGMPIPIIAPSVCIILVAPCVNVNKGEIVALVRQSGSGKSVIAVPKSDWTCHGLVPVSFEQCLL